jgi:hypothetical protein
MESHAAAQVDDVGPRVGLLQPLGQTGLRSQVIADIHQRLEHELADARGTLVIRLERVQAVRRHAHGDGDDVGVGRRLRGRAGREQCKMQNAEGRQYVGAADRAEHASPNAACWRNKRCLHL